MSETEHNIGDKYVSSTENEYDIMNGNIPELQQEIEFVNLLDKHIDKNPNTLVKADKEQLNRISKLVKDVEPDDYLFYMCDESDAIPEKVWRKFYQLTKGNKLINILAPKNKNSL